MAQRAGLQNISGMAVGERVMQSPPTYGNHREALLGGEEPGRATPASGSGSVLAIQRGPHWGIRNCDGSSLKSPWVHVTTGPHDAGISSPEGPRGSSLLHTLQAPEDRPLRPPDTKTGGPTLERDGANLGRGAGGDSWNAEEAGDASCKDQKWLGLEKVQAPTL